MVDDDLVIGGEGGRVADVVAASDKRGERLEEAS